MRYFVDTDINNNFQAENDPQFGMEVDDIKKPMDVSQTSENNQKITSGPKNKLDWKVHDFGLNLIQSPPPIILYDITDWTIAFAPTLSIIDASAFARYVKWDAWHQNQLNQLEYIEERIENDREQKKDLLDEKPKIKEGSSVEQINIERMDAA